MQRKLLAILAVDLVGYSRMMGQNEASTIAALQGLRTDIFGPVFADHKGAVVKSMGDGWLVEFGSSVDAVNAAMQVQDRLRNHASIRLRMGIHIGDVTRDENDIYGDGINIAARLEALSPEGGIVISDAVYSSLDGTLAPSFEAAGTKTLKNIARPVTIWVRPPFQSTGNTSPTEQQMRSNLPELLIRPVQSSDPRDEIQDLANALTADLNSFIGSVNWLQTSIGSGTSATGYTLVPSLRARADRLRMETRVMDCNGGVVWTHKSDTVLDDAFDWQDKVVADISDHTVHMILEAETLKLAAVPDDALTGGQCLLMGIMAWRSAEQEAFVRSIAFHDRAIAANPDLPDAYAEAIMVAMAAKTLTDDPLMRPYIDKVPEWIEAARPLSAGHATLTLSIAIATYMQDKRAPQLKQAVSQTLRLAPFDARILSFCGWANLWSGQTQDALDCFTKSIQFGRMGPFLVAALGGAATACVQLGNDARALEFIEEGLALTDRYPTYYSSKSAALALSGRMEEARAVMAQYLALSPDANLKQWREVSPYGGCAGAERYFEGLRLAGLPTG
jgi:adenylate cyclase